MSGRGGIALLVAVLIVALTLWAGRGRRAAPEPEEPRRLTAASVAATKVPVSENPGKNPLPELRAELDRTYADLPDIETVEAAGLDPHHPPPALFPATKALGEIRDHVLAIATKEAFAEAAGFYDRCARKEGALASLRVLCLRNLMDLAAGRPAVVTLNLSTFPPSITRLAQQVPPLEY